MFYDRFEIVLGVVWFFLWCTKSMMLYMGAVMLLKYRNVVLGIGWCCFGIWRFCSLGYGDIVLSYCFDVVFEVKWCFGVVLGAGWYIDDEQRVWWCCIWVYVDVIRAGYVVYGVFCCCTKDMVVLYKGHGHVVLLVWWCCTKGMVMFCSGLVIYLLYCTRDIVMLCYDRSDLVMLLMV